ncbi:MAG TPA: LysR substrate-binding domain-containing protein, partial [Polyangiaceae bacterium]|nr:LysR substrate-binding domain-containing protein [Polyangiaceae bacterium]
IGIRGATAFNRWRFVRSGDRTEIEVRPAVETNDAEVLRGMTVAGAGLTVLPDYLAEEDLAAGRLVRILDSWALSRVPVYAVYASTAGLPRAAREWIRAMKNALSAQAPRSETPRSLRRAASHRVVRQSRAH